MSLISIISFYIGFETGLQADTTAGASQMLQWNAGFYLIIISMILFFVAFAVLKFLKPDPIQMTQNSFTQQQTPINQEIPPQQ